MFRQNQSRTGRLRSEWALCALLLTGGGTAFAQQSLLEPLPENAQPATSTSQGTSAAAPVAEDPGQSQRLSQLFYQIQVLQQEVQELRGLVEEQSFQLNRLARDQQEQYIDLDGRIAGLSGSSGRSSPAATPPGGTSVPASSAAGASSGDAAVTLPSAGAGGGSEREAYTAAFELMKARRFDESAQAFDSLINRYPNGQYTPNAFYWLGELYLAQNQSEQARQSFAQVLNLYPDHPKVPDSLYKLGVVYHRLGENDEAIGYFQRVIREYPNSSAAGLATRYMAELQ